MTSYYIQNKFATAEVILTSAVADDGTFTVAYPSGTTVASFNAGLAGSGSYLVLNDNDRWAAADPGFSVSYGASEITITNLSGYTWAAGTKVSLFFDQVDDRGGGVVLLTFPLTLASIADGDVVTNFRPGVDGVIEDVQFVTAVPASTASKLTTLNLEIGTTNLTGGTVALTTAAVNAIGKVVAGAAITGNNTLTRDSTLSVEASSTTAFVEGSGSLIVRIRLTK